MNKLKLQHKILILIIATFIIMAGVMVAYFYPNSQTISTLKKDIYDDRLQLAIYDQQKSNLEQTRLDYNKIKNDINDLAKIFIEKDKILDLVSSLETAAVQNNIDQDINLKSNSQATNENNIPLELSLTGQWTDIINYFGQIEKQNYYLLIYDLSISENGNNIRLTAQATAFSR